MYGNIFFFASLFSLISRDLRWVYSLCKEFYQIQYLKYSKFPQLVTNLNGEEDVFTKSGRRSRELVKKISSDTDVMIRNCY
jgi:hypothetical protein